MNEEKLAVVILAAGLGKRMKNPELPKVLAEMAGKPLIGHVLEETNKLSPDKIVIVVGYHREKVIDYVKSLDIDNIEYVVQEEQLGTGHAVDQARENLKDFDGSVLILAGDVPLLSSGTLKKLINWHITENDILTVLSTNAPDPTGYGRIVRDQSGKFQKITEQKDASEEELKLHEVNSGVFILARKPLFDSLSKVNNNNAQGEYYLTDIVEILKEENQIVKAYCGAKFEELQGVNSPEQLEKAEQVYHNLKNQRNYQ